MAITAMATWPASARGGRTNVVDRWVSEPPRTWVTVASGTLPHRRMVFAWIIARRSVRQSPSCPVRLVPDGFYGHVGVVEAVNGNTITISEMNAAGGPYVVSYRTLYNASQFWYVH